MAITVVLRHATSYKYDKAVGVSPQMIRLRPAPHTRTPIRSYRLTIRPENHFINWQQDAFGNFAARVVLPEPTDHFEIEVELVAELVTINPFDFFLDESAEQFPFDYNELTADELGPYLTPREPLGPLLEAWLADVDRSSRPTVTFLGDLAKRIQRELRYEIRLEAGVQTPEETLSRQAGSCRDSSWLLVEILRHLGLAARFVSGYLVQLVPDEPPLEGPAGPSEDFSDLHAWAEVYLPGAGWFGLDPTSGLATSEGHIPLACTPTPQSAAPITGATDPTTVTFGYENQVQRVIEPPRVTKPYDDSAWSAINALGQSVDVELDQADVRLTMGGEPTFVSVDDMEGEAWTTGADSPEKRELASSLVGELWDRFAPGGVLHCGHGKWYPGEPLPRWQYSLSWRKDGEPIWRNRELLASPEADGGYANEDARRLAEAVAGELGFDPDVLLDAYEDPVYLVWREANVPIDIDPLDHDLDDPSTRDELARTLERGGGTPIGCVLPLAVADGAKTWTSSRWPLRRSQLFAMAGTSPLGFRLPLDTLPADPAVQVDPVVERDPLEDVEPLPTADASQSWAAVVLDDRLVRTALAIEVRDGSLCVFLPPLPTVEAALELLRSIENAAAATGLAIVLEGYPLPRDNRTTSLAVTPDPGVIEVNVHPTSSWDEYVEVTSELYRIAHETRLGTEKFQLDGRHSGTGGGNHVTLGGATPADSPLLRRPTLLTSLLRYWQHHPALSFLFSGLFVGPTSQAPRVDEARHENLYELEIALSELEAAADPPPWLVDRALRHLLTDLTGNTHRSEFCIDKLYSPDSATGRLGLLELRAFEMPPHWQMGAVQALLVRSLVARFWSNPYEGPLVSWGNELHDRFMLSHYVASDMDDVVADLNRWGFPFDRRWLDPFLEFRFPRLGAVLAGDVSLELRTAIEPWPVLGEEAAAGATARYVDSSMERIEVVARGWNPARHELRCNDGPVPLHSTGTNGEHVAGIRYRAWCPPSALHPTIGVDVPLKLEIVDRWTGAAIAGCTYHVVHPGGRSYEVFPVNALEAEARRQSRFVEHRHIDQVAPATPEQAPWVAPPDPEDAPGVRLLSGDDVIVLGEETASADFPHSFDLRRRAGLSHKPQTERR